MLKGLLFLAFHYTFQDGAFCAPTVATSCGALEGVAVSTPRGQCDAYLGVPFAAPPIGDLRWKKPQPLTCWTDTRKAVSLPPKCVSAGSNGTELEHVSEDCLYMNIFVPKLENSSNTKLPVMVYIHGGSFAFGSASDMGKIGPCENVASRGVVLVLIQYRLFMYGFFSTGDSTALGNYALWDQIESLKWVKANIESFGGDPNSVTIFGESAGGASVSYLTYMPVAKDLFHRSIAQSGSAFTPWAPLIDVSVESASRLATAAGCTNADSGSYVDCLRKLSTVELQAVYLKTFNMSWTEFFHIWSARIDGELFTDSNFKELENDDRPMIIGTNSMEIPMPSDNNSTTRSAIDQFKWTLDQTFKSNNTKRDAIMKSVVEYIYISSKGDPNDEHFVRQQSAKFLAHIGFHAPAALEATFKFKANRPIWMYSFDFWSENAFPDGFTYEKGAPHAHELCYMYRLNFTTSSNTALVCPGVYNADYGIVADNLAEMWTNFAIKGDPSPAGLVWPRFQNISTGPIMSIRSNLSIEKNTNLEYVQFWNLLKEEIDDAFGVELSPNFWYLIYK